MSTDEKIGQLIMLSAYSNKSTQYEAELESLITQYHIGGLVFFQGNAERQIKLTNRFQEISEIPLFIGIDAEWGLGMRLSDIESFPRNMTLGAIDDERYVYNLAAEIARQCRIMGVHVNFAPVLDVNNNPRNPVINMRSFGENPEKVGRLGKAFVNGLQENGVMAVGKHFPGHGDTGIDSHYSLPLISQDMERLKTVELVPFKSAFETGMSGVMVAHLNIPALEKKSNWPSSLSKSIITDLLINTMNYQGLIFTDAMNMKGVTSIVPSGDAEVNAFLAGNDIILMPVDLNAVFNSFKKAINDKKLSIKELDRRVLKILKMKEKYVIPNYGQKSSDQIALDLNRNTENINENLFGKAITIVRDNGNILPFRQTDKSSFASLSINCDKLFQNYLEKYADFDHYELGEDRPGQEEDLISLLSQYDYVVIGLSGVSYYPGRNYGIKNIDIELINRINKNTNTALVVFGNPYSLKYFPELNTIVSAYEGLPAAYKVVPQVLFAALPAEGTLPVTVDPDTPEGTGIKYGQLGMLSFGNALEMGFLESGLQLIDTIIYESIKNKVMPGCQVLIAREGRIVYDKNFGFHTYDSLEKVMSSSVYDLASVTKVAGSIQALMMLYEEGKVDLDKKLSFYLPSLKGTNKEDMIIRDILTHQAGLYPYMPYWKYTLKKYDPKNDNYRFQKEDGFTIELTDDLFARNSLPDTIWQWMINSDLLEKKDELKPYDYKYSDMGFYLIQKLIDKLAGRPIDEFLREYLYNPLALRTLCFSPKNHLELNRIVPSSIDNYFRNGEIRGNVNDEIGAIYGGVAGHAGLFSNAYDLAVLMQMNLQKGYYGGVQYFQPSTIMEFTKRQYRRNRRGLGWDKPQIIGDEYNPASFLGSEISYGHSGFTGTFAWVDPEYELIYIFLSNRTFPDQDNRKLIDEDVRKRIQTIIYSSIIK